MHKLRTSGIVSQAKLWFSALCGWKKHSWAGKLRKRTRKLCKSPAQSQTINFNLRGKDGRGIICFGVQMNHPKMLAGHWCPVTFLLHQLTGRNSAIYKPALLKNTKRMIPSKCRAKVETPCVKSSNRFLVKCQPEKVPFAPTNVFNNSL